MDRFVIKKPKKANTSVSVVNTVPEYVAAKSAEEDISVGSDQCSLHSENVPIDDVVCSSVLQASSLDEAEDVIFLVQNRAHIQSHQTYKLMNQNQCVVPVSAKRQVMTKQKTLHILVQVFQVRVLHVQKSNQT
ncbi:Hypothetical predicted protein [Pelobates cultripes]|uniref:Uncharacterized protein n=1 Tax=Pelobates cultripes TaxID=61616 RepID=A0AAD1S4N6_PELCU|nr:Hypothetical predicted protein [Pelobates cultripes]